jgi:hypothetical protein
MQMGKDIHEEAEHYLLTGKMRDSNYGGLNYRPYVEALLPHLPPPMHEELIVEQEIDLEVIPGITWKGYIDHGIDSSGEQLLSLGDIKTTSNIQRAKTPAELMYDIQMMSYGRWVYEKCGYKGTIDLRHLYVQTSKDGVAKKPKTKVVNIVADEEHVAGIWEQAKKQTEIMQLASQCSSAHDLEPNTDSCHLYPPDGCPFKKECGLTAKDFFSLSFKKKEKGTDMSKFLAKLKAKNNGESGASILPPDAPSRETEVTEEEEPKVASKPKNKFGKKAFVKKTTAKPSEPEPEEEETEEEVEAPVKPKKLVSKAKADTGGLAIYIDCMPVKDVASGGVEPTLFEDWFAGIVQEMDAEVAEEQSLPSYLLLPYSEEKAMIKLTVAEHLDKLPPTLVVNSGTVGAKEVLSTLIPHATLVVRATRG